MTAPCGFLSALLLSVLLLGSANAAGSLGDAAAVNPRKLLVEKVANPEFPYINCQTRSEASPYLLDGPPPVVREGKLFVNLTIVGNPTMAFEDDCFNAINDHLYKINIKSSKECIRNVKAFVNGAFKRIHWDTYTHEDDVLMRITNLKFDQDTLGATLDLVGTGPCNSIEALAGPAGGFLTYITTNNATTKCCPINKWAWGYSAPSPATLNSLTVGVALDGYWTPELVAQSNPLPEDALVSASNSVLETAGFSFDVMSTMPNVYSSPLGAGVTLLFTSPETLQAAATAIVPDLLGDFIQQARVPCGSALVITLSPGETSVFTCEGAGAGEQQMVQLCQFSSQDAGSDITWCAMPHGHDPSPPPQEESMPPSPPGTLDAPPSPAAPTPEESSTVAPVPSPAPSPVPSPTPEESSSSTPEESSSSTPEESSSSRPEESSNGTPEESSNGTPEESSSGTPEESSSGTPEESSGGAEESSTSEESSGVEESSM